MLSVRWVEWWQDGEDVHTMLCNETIGRRQGKDYCPLQQSRVCIKQGMKAECWRVLKLLQRYLHAPCSACAAQSHFAPLELCVSVVLLAD